MRNFLLSFAVLALLALLSPSATSAQSGGDGPGGEDPELCYVCVDYQAPGYPRRHYFPAIPPAPADDLPAIPNCTLANCYVDWVQEDGPSAHTVGSCAQYPSCDYDIGGGGLTEEEEEEQDLSLFAVADLVHDQLRQGVTDIELPGSISLTIADDMYEIAGTCASTGRPLVQTFPMPRATQ